MPPTEYKDSAVFLRSVHSAMLITCVSFVRTLCRLRDDGVRVAALSPCPTAEPDCTNYANVATFLKKVGGYASWKEVAQQTTAKLREICASEGIDFIDTYHALVHPITGDTPEALRVGDGWHLNAAAGHVVAVCVHDFYHGDVR